MKYIKKILEFNRTIGFRYSEPTIGYKATLQCIGELEEDSFNQLLEFLEIKNENVRVTSEDSQVFVEDLEINTNLTIEFNFFVYSEQELEKIAEDIRNGLSREFEVQVLDFAIGELPRFKKR